ncbi:MAG TPA: Asp-tRNA(Asn)/Glu-tRNA(Gln) amidotransferase subunit GatB [Chitinophagaceae bacterium]|nr:Asp-tRNA(Asn)/Glu-tRNA(Gln) amidotransferase subunit GatB [Chitinophagaceae bacterium]
MKTTPGYKEYEIVVGLEVHAQLLTKSKLFCGDSAAYGAEPNTHVSPITLAHPGTLPKMNKKAIEFAIKMGLTCHCEIEKDNYFARKNYFYPDLPKGYQVSQHTTPICKGGYVKIKTVQGEKNIRLNRIHLEEDAGKSLHDIDPNNTCIDFNRSGTPLIEIVSEPDIRGGEEAFLFLTDLRKLVRYLNICDGNMEKGSLRCDANVSVRKKGEITLGTKVEIKNLNSIRNVKKAIDFEAERLISLLESKQPIIQETKSFDADTGTTFTTREKEDADDYRYFPEPDLTPFHVENDFIENVRRTIPVLQEERVRKYISEFNLSEYDAQALTEEKSFSDYFEKIISFLISSEGKELTPNFKAAVNWMLGPVRSWLNENNKEIGEFSLLPQTIVSLIGLIDSGKISFSVASARIFPLLINDPSKEPTQLIQELNLVQESDAAALEPIIDEVLIKYADKVSEYKKGKRGLLALFVGEVMKRSKGKADPKVTNELILQKLKS